MPLIFFFAAFTQSLSGFGLGLIAMPLLTLLVGLKIIEAVPTVTLVAVAAQIALLVRYRASINLRALWRLNLASIAGVPVGLYALKHGNRGALQALLGLVVCGYAVYALLNLPLPRMKSRRFAYLFGLTGGFLGGSLSTSGPPVVIYGTASRWEPEEFKSTLQGYFIVLSVAAISGHVWYGNITHGVMNRFLISLPGAALGVLAGVWMSRFLNAKTFRKIVLCLLVVLGIMQIVNGVRTVRAKKMSVAEASARVSRTPRAALTVEGDGDIGPEMR